jgi:uncharacterized protein (DUF779 family)
LPTATSVTGTESCRLLIGQLADAHGPLSIHVSANYGMTVVCLPEKELSLGARDVLVGRIDGVPLFMMTSEIDLWEGSVLVLDVARGAGAGFSLESPRGVHFTLRKRAHPDKRSWDADAILAAGPPPSHLEGTHEND